jgi:hypothetical protein
MTLTSELIGLGLAAEGAVELSQTINGTIVGKPVVEGTMGLVSGDTLSYDPSLDAWITTNVTDGGQF